MPAPQPLDSPASPAAARRRRRATSLKRTLIGCAALFSVMFCLLAAQMLLGRDPALGDGAQTRQAAAPTMTASAGGSRSDASWVDVALGVVQSLASGDDEHGDDGGSSSSSSSSHSAPLTSRSS